MGPLEIAVVQSDTTDIGTGTYTILTQVAAEALRLPTLPVLRRQGHHHHHHPEPVDERLVRAVKNGRSVGEGGVVSVRDRVLRRPQRHAPCLGKLTDHVERCLPFRKAVGLGETRG
jgi:hypothetical protein